MLFGFLVGFGATIAEPAVAALQKLGSSVPAWKSPLLYLLLEQHTDILVLSIGIGVGVAVIFGLIRFTFGFSIKPLIFTIIPIVLGTTILAHTHDKLRSIIGLAWDSGAVTTGAVTVPLVLAIGIGVSRASGKNEGARGSFGIIMLASAFPILSVLILGFTHESCRSGAGLGGGFFCTGKTDGDVGSVRKRGTAAAVCIQAGGRGRTTGIFRRQG
ncbi:MAG: DUF1538 family protein [Spirochaetia bacterium]|nr:DUF1538 family protein [Spirochaetia bacterium]